LPVIGYARGYGQLKFRTFKFKMADDRHLEKSKNEKALIIKLIQSGPKKVIPLIHYITLYERYHFFGPPCTCTITNDIIFLKN